MKLEDLELEYAPTAAQRSQARAAERWAQQAEHERRQAQPIDDPDELARAVGRLADRWGLKKRGGRKGR